MASLHVADDHDGEGQEAKSVAWKTDESHKSQNTYWSISTGVASYIKLLY